MKVLLQLFLWLLPRRARIAVLRNVMRYEIDAQSSIGFSIILAQKVILKKGSRIGHFNVVKGLETLHLSEYASIGNLNWITGFPLGTTSAHFADEVNRTPALRIGEHSAITNRHLIDCTATVTIGRFSTFAGFRSQLLTHSIDLASSRQRSAPVAIGDYCFVGTASVILPGSRLPSYSVLGGSSLLNKAYAQEYMLYAGNPAVPVKELDRDSLYFRRPRGYVT